MKASLKMRRIGAAVLQCSRFRPMTWNCRWLPSACRKQGIVGSVEQHLRKMLNPVDDDPADVVTDWKEGGGKGLVVLCPDLAPVLDHPAPDDVDMLQLERSDGAVAGAGQQGRSAPRNSESRALS